MVTLVQSNMPGLSLAATTSNATATVPAGHAIRSIYIRNSTANAVTGGIIIGTTDGGSDVMAALAVGANAIPLVTDALTLKRYFSASATQTLFIQAVVSWNSSSLDILIQTERAAP